MKVLKFSKANGGFAVIAFVCFLLFNTNVMAQVDSTAPGIFYGIKSCKIVYKFFNGLQEGERILIFDDCGKYEKSTTRMHMVMDSAEIDSMKSDPDVYKLIKSAPQETYILILRTPGHNYAVNLANNTGVALPVSNFSMGIPDNEKKSVGLDTVAGKPCERMEVYGGFMICTWKKIVLRKQIIPKVSGFTVEEYAIAVDEQYKIKPGEFDLPPAVKMK